MNILKGSIKRGWVFIVVAMLIPYMTATAQTNDNHLDSNQMVQFKMVVQTQEENLKEPSLILEIVDRLEANPHLVDLFQIHQILNLNLHQLLMHFHLHQILNHF